MHPSASDNRKEEPIDIEPLEVSGDGAYEIANDDLSPQELAQRDARNKFYAARAKLAIAQMQFDRRDIDREIERQQTEQGAEEFDVAYEDQCTLFVDKEHDGYQESHEAACTASVP